MKLTELIELLREIGDSPQNKRRAQSGADLDIVVEVLSPGSIGGTPAVAIKHVQAGFDWDSGKVIITPEPKLTTLTPEDVKAILDSCRKGQSWHAFKQYQRQQAEIEALEAKNAELLKALELAATALDQTDYKQSAKMARAAVEAAKAKAGAS